MARIIWFWICFTHVWAAPKRKLEEAMFWKPPKPEMAPSPEAMQARKKLGEKVVSLYKQNKLSAEDISQLLQTADAAGLEFANPIKKKKKQACKRLRF